MKNLNFIASLSPKEQRALIRWYRISVTLFSVFILACISVHGFQLYQWYQHYNEKKLFQTQCSATQHIETKHKAVKNKEAHLTTQIKKLEHIQTAPQLPTTSLYELSKLIPEKARLTKMTVAGKKRIILEGQAFETSDVINFLQNLQQSDTFKNMELLSLQASPSAQQDTPPLTTFVIKGMVQGLTK